MRRAKCFLLLFLVAFALAGCGSGGGGRRFRRTYFDAFDTAVTLIAHAPSSAAFDRAADAFSEKLYALDAGFDAYEPHPGTSGLHALNASGGAWIDIAPELYDLLLRVRDWDAVGRGRVNPALGNVFALWRAYREAGEGLPTGDMLAAAAAHADYASIELSGGRARLADPEVRIDLGAVAKGYAAGLLGELVSGICAEYLIDAGGNIVVGNAPEGGAWTVGVRDPDGASSLMVLTLENACAVTSGDYQRHYEVAGVRYHHLIDPHTLYPARFMRQATVICADSGWADFLSTLLFVMPSADALSLAEALDGVEAILVLNDATVQMTSGAGELVSG